MEEQFQNSFQKIAKRFVKSSHLNVAHQEGSGIAPRPFVLSPQSCCVAGTQVSCFMSMFVL